jgi:glycosyltransferase involved in cell wall biosynthesis
MSTLFGILSDDEADTEMTGHILQLLRLAKRSLLHIEFVLYQLALLSVRRSKSKPRHRITNILITGEVAARTGPYFFLINACNVLSRNFALTLCFSAEQITDSLESFCKAKGVRLIPRRKRKDFLDTVFLEFILRREGIDLLIINVSAFPRNVHLIATRTYTIYYIHSIWNREISRKDDWTLRRFIDDEHRIVTVSEAAQISIGKSYLKSAERRKKISCIYNSVEDHSDLTNTDRRTIVVLTLGVVEGHKNPVLWVRVAKKVIKALAGKIDIEFWWAGEGLLLPEVMEMSRGNPEIKFLGFISTTDALFARASIYYQPSEFENCSIAVCQALMFSLPCVVTNCGGLPEQVEHGSNGFTIEKGNENLMTEKIIELAMNEQERMMMGKRSREIYSAKFTEEMWESKIRTLFRELLG